MFSRASSALVLLAFLAVLAPVRSAPTLLTPRQDGAPNTTATNTSSFQKQNALDAQKLNAQFSALKETDSCTDGDMACVNSAFAQCIQGKWALTQCQSGLQCVALPLVNKPGTSIACDTDTDATRRFKAAGVEGGISGDGAITGNTTKTTVPSDGDCEDDETSVEDQNDDCEDDDGNTQANGQHEAEDCEDDNENTHGDGHDQDCEDEDSTSTASTSSTATKNGVEITSTPAPFTVTVTIPPPSATSPAVSSSSPAILSLVSSVSAPAASQAVAGYKRQLQTFSSAPSTVTISEVSEATVTVTVPAVTSTAIASSTSSQVTVTITEKGTNIPTSSSIGVDPTGVVIGADGLRTITVVSTVTVGCSASTSAIPTSVSSSASSATVSPLSRIIFSSTATSSPSSSVASTTESAIVVLTSSSVSAVPSSTSSSSSAALTGFSFSFSSAPTITPAPSGHSVNNASGNTSFNVSDLISATLA